MDRQLFGYRLPDWLLSSIASQPAIGNQALVFELAFPGQPLGKQNPIDWGFPGDLNHFQWQTNLTLRLPTRGGPFAAELGAERQHATGGRPAQAQLYLVGRKADPGVKGTLSGVLGPAWPYVVAQKLEVDPSVNTRLLDKQVGLVQALAGLQPFGPAASVALGAVPAIRDWVNRRASFYVTLSADLTGKFELQFQPDFAVSNAVLGVDFPLELGAQADLWVAEGRVYGGLGGMAAFGYAPDDLRIASLQAYGRGGYKSRVTWFSLEDEGEWKLADMAVPGRQRGPQLRAGREPAPAWRLIAHNSSPETRGFGPPAGGAQAFAQASGTLAAWTQAARISAASTVTSVLVSNVYTYTEPSLALDPGTGSATLLWVHDDPGKPVGQAHEIAYSRGTARPGARRPA